MKKEILSFVTIQMDPEDTMLSEKRERRKLDDMNYMWNLKQPPTQIQRTVWWLPQTRG